MRSATAVLLLGLLLAAPCALLAETHVVTQEGITFVPADLLILKHDRVRWVWTAASHTVTNGTGSGDPQAGTLFDAPLSPEFPAFEYPFDEPGVFPYFCFPHEFFGMQGTITVDEQVPTEPTTWGKLKRQHRVPEE